MLFFFFFLLLLELRAKAEIFLNENNTQPLLLNPEWLWKFTFAEVLPEVKIISEMPIPIQI